MNPNRARLQTRTPETEAKYLLRARGILARLAKEMGMPEDTWPEPASVVDYMRRNASQWKWATYRQYQASLASFYDHEAELSGESEFRRIAEEIRRLPWTDCKPENEVGRTSSRKSKGIPERDFELLIANLATPANGSRWARLAARWLQATVPTGLRPCEWQQAKIKLGDDQSPVLEVLNAKTTNGRGNGKTRDIPLSGESAPAVHSFLDALRALLDEGVTFSQAHERCAQEIRRTCHKVWGRTRPRRYTLYSARHQFSANTKAQQSQDRVAELLGHSSKRTARRHYAPRRRAWLRWRQNNKPAPQPGNGPST